MKAKILKQIIKEISPLFVGSKPLPILEDFLISEHEIRYTDLETTIVFHVKEKIINSPCTVTARTLQKIVKGIDGCSEVKFETKEEARPKIGVHTDNGRFWMKGRPHEEFPDPPTIKTEDAFEILPSDIDILKRAIKYVSKDELRMAMCGVFVDDGTAAATDAHKLYWEKMSGSCGDSFIIPSKSIKCLDRRSCLMKKDKTNALFHYVPPVPEITGKTIISRLVDAKYPEYKAVIPEEQRKSFTVNNDEFQKAITAGLICAGEINKIHLVLNGDARLKAMDLDFGAEYENILESGVFDIGEDQNFEIAFNGRYMLDIVKEFNKEAEISITLDTPNRAFVIEDSFLLMPVSVSG